MALVPREPGLPGLGRAQEHVVGVQDGEHEPAPAVEEAPLDNVHREEAAERPEDEVGEAGALPAPDPLAGGQGGVAVRRAGRSPPGCGRSGGAAPRRASPPVPPRAPTRGRRRRGSGRRGGGRGAAGSRDRGRRAAPRPPRTCSGGAPSSRRPGPSSARTRAIRSRSSGVTRSSASSDSTQSPVACSRAKFFWAAKPGPGPHPDAVGELPGERDRLVGGLGVHDDDLVGPGHALEAGAQALLLVPRHDGHGEPRHRARAPLEELLGRREGGVGGEPGHGAVRALEPPTPRPVGAIALRPRGPEEAERRRAQGGGEVQRAGVARHHQAHAPEHGGQLVEVGGRGQHRAGAEPGADAPGHVESRRAPRGAAIRAPASAPRRAASARKRSTGHCFSGRPAPGIQGDDAVARLEPDARRGRSSIRRSASGPAGRWNSGAAGGDAERPEQGQVSAPPRARRWGAASRDGW